MLAVEIEKSWSDLQEAYAQIVLARRSVDSATENLRENRNFYQAGTAPLTDLLDAETLYTHEQPDVGLCRLSYGDGPLYAGDGSLNAPNGSGWLHTAGCGRWSDFGWAAARFFRRFSLSLPTWYCASKTWSATAA